MTLYISAFIGDYRRSLGSMNIGQSWMSSLRTTFKSTGKIVERCLRR